MVNNNNQRIGAKSNTHEGIKFENTARAYFRQIGILLKSRYSVPIGLSRKGLHEFDLGSDDPPILVECKSHKWTANDNVPSAKMTVWTEAMYYFHLAPEKFRKVLFVLRDYSEKREATLAEYYVRNRGHLIPNDVEILEYDESTSSVRKIR